MSTDNACPVLSAIEHTVTFSFYDNPGDVVRTTGGDWARLTGVTVHLYDDREPRIWAGGRRCRKDGEPDRRMGNISTSVELPDPDVWIDRARRALLRSTQLNTAGRDLTDGLL